MSGYPVDVELKHCTEVWRRTTKFPGLGDIIILATIEPAWLNTEKIDGQKWIGQVTFTLDMVGAAQNCRNSGYMFHEWFSTKEAAINQLFEFLYRIRPTELDVKTIKDLLS
jgi:hypothetical protein